MSLLKRISEWKSRAIWCSEVKSGATITADGRLVSGHAHRGLLLTRHVNRRLRTLLKLIAKVVVDI